MINKRILIKNLLAQNDENSFYDKKQQLNLHDREGKSKFLKHICALSNSNPNNNSYIVVGVDDKENTIIGVDFYDDSRIQNLVNAYLENPPQIQYENVHFPKLPKNKVVGLVTIQPNKTHSFFKKNIHSILANNRYIRQGSTTLGIGSHENYVAPNNLPMVQTIENNARNNIGDTLDSVFDFMNQKHKGMAAKYKVFKELYVICWGGITKKVQNTEFLSRVSIELINEQVKLFYSDQDVVVISFDEDVFTIIEYVPLGLNAQLNYYPLEKKSLHFFENGYYKIETEMLLEAPKFDKQLLFHSYNSSINLLQKCTASASLSPEDILVLENLPTSLLICYLNGFLNAIAILIEAKSSLKPYPKVFDSFKDVMRIVRKMKYDKA